MAVGYSEPSIGEQPSLHLALSEDQILARLRRSARFFIKNGLEYCSGNGVVKLASAAIHDTKLAPEYHALCQFIDEERARILADQPEALDAVRAEREANNDNFLKEVKEKTDTEDKVELIKQYVEKGGADFILQHFFEFNLPPKQEKALFLFIADNDPEIILRNIAHLDINDYGRKEIIDRLFSKIPVQVVYAARELNIGEHELENYLDQFVIDHSLVFLESIGFILKRHEFPGERKAQWEKHLAEYVESLTAPGDVLLAIGHIEVYDIFPQLQQKIDQKIRDSIKYLGTQLYERLVVVQQEAGGKDYLFAARVKEEVSKLVDLWGCYDFEHDIFAFAGWCNEPLDESEREKIPSYCFPVLDDKLKANTKFLLVSDASARIAAGHAPYHSLEEVIVKSVKHYDVAVLEELFAQLLPWVTRGEVGYLPCLLDIVDALPISTTERAVRYKKIIDLDPINSADYFIDCVFSVFNDDVRLYLINLLADKDPHCLARNYNKFPLRDRTQEEKTFKKLIAEGIEPFARLKNVNVSLPLLRSEAFSFVWSKSGQFDEEKARDNLLTAREFLSEQTWQFILRLSRAPDAYGLYGFFLKMNVDSYRALEAIVRQKGFLFHYFFESPRDDKEKNQLEINDRLALIPFIKVEDIPAWENRIRELNELEHSYRKNERQKMKKVEARRKSYPRLFENQRNLVLVMAMSLGCPAEDAYEKMEKFNGSLEFQAFSPVQNPRRQIEFLLNNWDRVSNFVDTGLVAGRTNRIISIILSAENPGRKLAFMERFANNLDCPVPMWEQLAVLSKTLLLEQMSENIFVRERVPMSCDSYMWQGFSEEEKVRLISEGEEQQGLVWIQGEKFSPEQMKRLISNRLQKILEIDRADIEAAAFRNKNFAESQSAGLVLPMHTLLHFSYDDTAGDILRIGNLCGECLGVKSDRDSYPYHVDTVRVQENTPNRDIATVLHSPLNVGYDLMFFYPFRSAETAFHFREEFPVSSFHFNHHLIFGALPRTEVGGIVLNLRLDKDKEEKAQILEKLKQDIVKNDIYVPIFNHDGTLLFSYDEFSSMWQELKPFSSVEKFLAADSALDHLDVPGGGGHKYTVKRHSLLVEERALSEAGQKNMSPKMQTVLRLAARLHDSGKGAPDSDVQEITNVVAAREILNKIRFLQAEDERLVLKFVRNDELLGEILKGMHFESGKWHQDKESRDKFKKFQEVFVNEEERVAILALYKADVRSIGGEEYNQWMVEEKLKELKLV